MNVDADDDDYSTSIETESDTSSTAETESARLPRPVSWRETSSRSDYFAEYVPVGSLAGVLRDHLTWDETLDRLLSQTLFLTRKSRERKQASARASMVSSIFMKFLQRGRAPLPTLGIEAGALREAGLFDQAKKLASSTGALGWKLPRKCIKGLSATSLQARLAHRRPFETVQLRETHDAEVDERNSDSVFQNWLATNVGDSAGHWLVPGASSDALLNAGGFESGDVKPIDLLFACPGSDPLVIEIERPSEKTSDMTHTRDVLLARMNIKCMRVSENELRRGTGANLDSIAARCRAAIANLDADRCPANIGTLAVDATIASKVQFAITKSHLARLARQRGAMPFANALFEKNRIKRYSTS